MKKQLSIGLVGCGVMGKSLVGSLAEIEGAKLTVAYDPVKESAEAVGQTHGAAVAATLDALLGRRGLHGIIVATPPFKHKEVAVSAAKAGKHVFLEKPMAPTVKDCDAILEAAHAARIKLMIGQVCRFHAVHRRVRDLVAEGKIGKPIFMQVYRLGGGWGGIWAQSWRMKRSLSGGTLMEINAHEIDFLRFVCGEVRTVYAAGDIYLRREADYPDVAAVTLTLTSGAVGFLHSSQVSAIGGYGGRVDGTEGSIHFPAIWGDGAGIHFKRWESAVEFTPAAEIKVMNPVRAELEGWIDAIRTDTDPPIPGEEGRAAVQIAEAAYTSIETGKPVHLK